jgi:hypothetical protein
VEDVRLGAASEEKRKFNKLIAETNNILKQTCALITTVQIVRT